MPPTTDAPSATADLIAAALLTSATGAELHLFTQDGRRLRLATDAPTAWLLAGALWPALEHCPARLPG